MTTSTLKTTTRAAPPWTQVPWKQQPELQCLWDESPKQVFFVAGLKPKTNFGHSSSLRNTPHRLTSARVHGTTLLVKDFPQQNVCRYKTYTYKTSPIKCTVTKCSTYKMYHLQNLPPRNVPFHKIFPHKTSPTKNVLTTNVLRQYIQHFFVKSYLSNYILKLYFSNVHNGIIDIIVRTYLNV
jgi:hypothetical protein